MTRDFSIFLCHTNRSVRLASPKGFTLSVYPAISPCFSRAASFLAIFAARCLRCSSLFPESESEESDEDEEELDGSRLDLFFFDLLLDFFSFFSFLLFFLEPILAPRDPPLRARVCPRIWTNLRRRMLKDVEHPRVKIFASACIGGFFRPSFLSHASELL